MASSSELSYDECVSIIRQFRARHSIVVMDRNVHGVVVTMVDGDPVLELRVTAKYRPHLEGDAKLPSPFEYRFDDQTKSIRTSTKVTEIPAVDSVASSVTSTVAAPEPRVRGGDSGIGEDLHGCLIGTCGWSILLNGVPVGISNWHVFCGLGNNTPFGRRVFLRDRDVSSLYAFQPPGLSGEENTWDYALARYDNVDDIAATMRPCDDGTVFPYPRALSKNVVVGSGATYHKVGHRGPLCRRGVLDTVGSTLVGYGPMGTAPFALFQGQLFFSKMSDGGDSGSVIVREADNTVTGLNFAGSDDATVANPLFLNNWGFVGTLTLTSGAEVPALEGPLVPVQTRPAVEVTPGQAVSSIVLGNTLRFNDVIRPLDDIPNLGAGKLFLGITKAVVDFDNRRIGSFLIRPPAPIRNVPVEFVIGGIDPSSAQNPTTPNVKVCVFLCFG